MRLLFGFLCIIGGLSGIAISFLSDIVVTSTVGFFDGLELTIWLGLFSGVVFVSGVFNLFASS
jgi:hypothetical protein